MIDHITKAELAALQGAPDATHCVFHPDGELYFCIRLPHEVEDIEAEYWKAAGGYVMKRVDNGSGE